MSLERLAKIAEFGWLAVALGAHAIVLAFCHADHAAGSSTVGIFAAEILRVVQLSLLPLWLMLGPGPKRVRWLAVPMFAGVLYAWSDLPYPRVGTQTFWLGLETAGMLLILTLLLRLLGKQVQRPQAGEPIPPLQFSIRGLLITTTLAALAIAAGKWIYTHVQAAATDSEPSILELDPLIARTAVAAGLATISLAACWAVFRRRHVWLASGGVAALSCGCGMLMTLLLHEGDAWMSFGLWWLLHSLAIMATLAPLRQMGFRMTAAACSPAVAPSVRVEKSKLRGIHLSRVS